MPWSAEKTSYTKLMEVEEKGVLLLRMCLRRIKLIAYLHTQIHIPGSKNRWKAARRKEIMMSHLFEIHSGQVKWPSPRPINNEKGLHIYTQPNNEDGLHIYTHSCKFMWKSPRLSSGTSLDVGIVSFSSGPRPDGWWGNECSRSRLRIQGSRSSPQS